MGKRLDHRWSSWQHFGSHLGSACYPGQGTLKSRFLAIALPLFSLPALMWLAKNSSVWRPYSPHCIFHLMFGINCPGCGGTRAMILLFRGDLLGALRMNAFTTIALFFGVFLTVRYALTGQFDRDLLSKGRRPALIVAFVIAFFIVRNLPWPPFSWTAPPPGP